MRTTITSLAMLLSVLAPPPLTAQNVLSAEAWSEDLRFLATELPKRHREPFTKITRAQFDSAVSTLQSEIPSLADHEVIVGLARIVAMLQDGHTRLTLPEDTGVAFSRAHTKTDPPSDPRLYMHHLPVRFAHFPEGIFIRAAAPSHRDLIGTRVLEIGGMSTDSALERMRPVAEHDNESGFLLMGPVRLSIPEVLHAQGVVDQRSSVRLVVVGADSVRKTVVLAPLPLFGSIEIVEARNLGNRLPPIWERNLDQWYWMQYLPDQQALYVQINQVGSADSESMVAFTRRVRGVIGDSAVERLILDLRHSPGGNELIGRSFVTALIADEQINRLGRLYVLIGRETFSAAQLIVNDLAKLAQPIFVGEPTGNSPSSYSDSRKFKLPNSGLTIRASTVYWRSGSNDERVAATDPDFPVELAAADYFAYRDPVLDFALTFSPPGDPLTLSRAIQQRSGFDAVQRVCASALWDVDLPLKVVEARLASCGSLALEANDGETSAAWFEFTISHFPTSAPAHYGLAKALELIGRKTDARAAAEKAVRLDPSYTPAAELLRELQNGDG